MGAMTLAPLPTWTALRRGLSGAPVADSELTAPWRRAGDVAGLLSRSSWSLALIAQWRRRLFPDRAVTMWLPAFFCNSALPVVRRAGVMFAFYDLTDALEPNMASLNALAASGAPDIVVVVHYFGRPSPTAPVHDFCARHRAWLVEDAAHVLRPVPGVGAHGDFVVYSPHKHLPIPDGAVLVAREGGTSRFGAAGVSALGEPATWPAQLQDLERAMAPAVQSVRARATKWLIKRSLQKLGVGRSHRPLAFAEPAATDESFDLPEPRCSDAARAMLAIQIEDLGARKRERHQLLWDAALNGHHDTRAVPAHRPLFRAWTPYLAAYSSPSDAAEAVYRDWGSRGALVTTWPDMPPEVKADTAKYAHAWQLRHSRIYLPVHASLSAPAIARHSARSDPRRSAEIEMKWISPTADQWQLWMQSAGRSNLLQDWAYGLAKAGESGWSLRHAVFISGGAEPIAIAQFLERRIAGLLTLRRMNRAPLFLGTPNDADSHAVWHRIAQLGSLARGQVLAAAPEAMLSGPTLLTFLGLGFRPSERADAWQSVWLDLTLDVEALRGRLQKEWRNALAASERAGLALDVSETEDAFEWMIERYQELMSQKHFSGPSVPLLRALRARARDGQVVVARALLNGEAVAGVLIVRHGDAATYLAGWNGPLGRQNKANHFLLWRMAEHLKASGARAFDLGGISDEHTPGITAFKLGMGGERYELAGEFLKW